MKSEIDPPEPEQRRFAFRTKPVPFRDRVEIYFRILWGALTTLPPKGADVMVEVFPGDKEYEEANFSVYWGVPWEVCEKKPEEAQ